MLTSDVLPAPFGPMIETIAPCGTATDTSRTAVTPPNFLETPSTVRIAGTSGNVAGAGSTAITRKSGGSESPTLIAGRTAADHRRLAHRQSALTQSLDALPLRHTSCSLCRFLLLVFVLPSNA